MSELSSISAADREVAQIIERNPSAATSELFERYRISSDRDAFVAALIARLCIAEARRRVGTK